MGAAPDFSGHVDQEQVHVSLFTLAAPARRRCWAAAMPIALSSIYILNLRGEVRDEAVGRRRCGVKQGRKRVAQRQSVVRGAEQRRAARCAHVGPAWGGVWRSRAHVNVGALRGGGCDVSLPSGSLQLQWLGRSPRACCALAVGVLRAARHRPPLPLPPSASRVNRHIPVDTRGARAPVAQQRPVCARRVQTEPAGGCCAAAPPDPPRD